MDHVPKMVAAVLALLAAATLLAGCAGDDGMVETMVEAKEMQFTPNTLRLAAGHDFITVHNAGRLRHTFSLNALGREVTINPGQTKTLTIDVTPGTYRFVCRVLDHEGLGMHGTLRVTKRT